MKTKKPVVEEVIPPISPEPVEYIVTQIDIDKTTDIEVAWGTTRCLPHPKFIPKEFYQGNIYTQIVDAMFAGEPAPEGDLIFHTGFNSDPESMKMFNKFFMAHLRSFEPKHEDKIAGIGYMISKIMTITPEAS